VVPLHRQSTHPPQTSINFQQLQLHRKDGSWFDPHNWHTFHQIFLLDQIKGIHCMPIVLSSNHQVLLLGKSLLSGRLQLLSLPSLVNQTFLAYCNDPNEDILHLAFYSSLSFISLPHVSCITLATILRTSLESTSVYNGPHCKC
jgi:hypothetical protein